MPNKIRAAKLLLKNFFPEKGNQIEVSHFSNTNGVSFDLYSPQGEIVQTFVMLYGLDFAGEKDPRLVKFAKAFALSGFQVAVPVLPGLKALTMDPGDIDLVCSLVDVLSKDFGEPIGITAFSVGGGLALVAAAELFPETIIDPLLLFSPHYSIMELWDTWKSTDLKTPTNDRELNHYIWNQMALAYRGIDRLNLTEEEERIFLDLLFNYCSESSLKKKKQGFDLLFAGRDIPGYGDFPMPRDEQTALSPKGKLRSIQGRVLILHDLNDLIIPPAHSTRIMQELDESREFVQSSHRLLITPMLSHVTVGNSWRVMDVFTILDIIGEIFHSPN